MTAYTYSGRRQFLLSSAALAAAPLLPKTAFARETSEFRIGSLNSITGVGGTYGPSMLESIRIATDEVNTAGGAAGLKLKIFAQDDQTKPDTGILGAKKLIDVNRVRAIVGVWPSSVGLAILPLTNNAGLIMMNTCGAPEMQIENKKGLAWMFQASNSQFGPAFAEIARRRGFKRPAVMAFNNSTFVGLADYFRKTWERDGGKVAAFVIYEPNQISYRTELNRVLAAKPDVIAMGAYKPDATIILKEWFQTGQDCKFIMPGWTANKSLVDALGADVTNGIISVSNIAAVDQPAYKAYAERFKGLTKKEPNIFGAESYDMIITLALAIEAAGAQADNETINRHIRAVCQGDGEKVYSFAQGRDALRKGRKINYDGASSKLIFNDHGATIPDFGVYELHGEELTLKEVIPGVA